MAKRMPPRYTLLRHLPLNSCPDRVTVIDRTSRQQEIDPLAEGAQAKAFYRHHTRRAAPRSAGFHPHASDRMMDRGCQGIRALESTWHDPRTTRPCHGPMRHLAQDMGANHQLTRLSWRPREASCDFLGPIGVPVQYLVMGPGDTRSMTTGSWEGHCRSSLLPPRPARAITHLCSMQTPLGTGGSSAGSRWKHTITTPCDRTQQRHGQGPLGTWSSSAGDGQMLLSQSGFMQQPPGNAKATPS